AQHDRGRVAAFVREAAGDDLHSLLGSEGGRRAPKIDLAPAALLTDHLDVSPFGPPVGGAEHLERGLLRGEARGEPLGASSRVGAAVVDLGVRVHALEITAAESLDGRLDAA